MRHRPHHAWGCAKKRCHREPVSGQVGLPGLSLGFAEFGPIDSSIEAVLRSLEPKARDWMLGFSRFISVFFCSGFSFRGYSFRSSAEQTRGDNVSSYKRLQLPRSLKPLRGVHQWAQWRSRLEELKAAEPDATLLEKRIGFVVCDPIYSKIPNSPFSSRYIQGEAGCRLLSNF